MKKKLLIILPLLLVVCILVSAGGYVGYAHYYIPTKVREYNDATEGKFNESFKALDDAENLAEKVFSEDNSNTDEMEDSIKLAKEFTNQGNELKKVYENSKNIPSKKPSHDIDKLDSLLSSYYVEYGNLVNDYTELGSYFESITPLLEAIDKANKDLNKSEALADDATEQEFIDFVDNYVAALTSNVSSLNSSVDKVKSSNIPASVQKENDIMVGTAEALAVFMRRMAAAFTTLKESYLNQDLALYESVSIEVSNIESDYADAIAELDSDSAEKEEKQVKKNLSDKLENLKMKESEIKAEFDKIDNDSGKILFGLVK